MPTAITVTADNHDQRLDIFLTSQLPDLTRSQIKKMILSGAVIVSGQKATVHRFLKADDVIEFVTVPERAPHPSGELIAANVKDVKVKVIAETPDYLIINKPAGLLVHPTPTSNTPTLSDWLVAHYPHTKDVGDSARPGIVHRLDRDVSGLMIIPTTQASWEYFKQQFKDRTLTKKYLTLVHGAIERDNGEINFPIARSVTKRGLFAARATDDPATKNALTRFNVLKRFRNFTYLEVQIFTGRTHQIRVHMLAYGTPIVGDTLYAEKANKKIELSRLFLHASELEFTDPQGNPQHFKLPLPKNLEQFMEGLVE
ncbi:MAG: RluA family pseudouridine synthase [Candidatus Buchananbacteria bacterium]|nr:RluA family pseudouridine synthase [Candidatus Buchananbacteria bacterium]